MSLFKESGSAVLCLITLTVFLSFVVHYVECHYTERDYTEKLILSVITLNAFMKATVILGEDMLYDIKLGVITLNAIILSG